MQKRGPSSYSDERISEITSKAGRLGTLDVGADGSSISRCQLWVGRHGRRFGTPKTSPAAVPSPVEPASSAAFHDEAVSLHRGETSMGGNSHDGSRIAEAAAGWDGEEAEAAGDGDGDGDYLWWLDYVASGADASLATDTTTTTRFVQKVVGDLSRADKLPRHVTGVQALKSCVMVTRAPALPPLQKQIDNDDATSKSSSSQFRLVPM